MLSRTNGFAVTKTRHYGLRFLIWITVTVTLVVACIAQQIVDPTKHLGRHSAVPPETASERQFPSPQDDDTSMRASRDQRFSHLLSQPLEDPGIRGDLGSNSTSVTHVDYIGGREALPTAKSDLVIVGHVLSAKGYVTPDKTGVYSEFKVGIDGTLKGDLALIGQTLTVLRGGGVVAFPSGHKRNILFAGIGYPKLNTSYVFFLRTRSNKDDFTILTAYELSGGHVYALDDEAPFTEHEGELQSKFISNLQSQISNETGGQK